MMVSACAVLGKRLVMSGGRASRHTHDSLHACRPRVRVCASRHAGTSLLRKLAYVPVTIYRKIREYGHRRRGGRLTGLRSGQMRSERW